MSKNKHEHRPDGPLVITDFPRDFYINKGLLWAPYCSGTIEQRLICLPPEVAYMGACQAFKAIGGKVVPFVLKAMKAGDGQHAAS